MELRGWSQLDEQNPVHSYADPGHYDVSLTVTDNGGATNAKTHRADVKE
jgi:PKD repeat protein